MIRKSSTVLALATILLLGLGIVMLCSTGIFAPEAKRDLYYTAKRQGVWIGIGLVVAAITTTVDYRSWLKLSWVGYGIGAIALICCFVPGIAALNDAGEPINGSYRWLGFGTLRVQPSEFAKLALLVVLAAWFARRIDESRQFLSGFFFPGLIMAVPVGLILMETDLGTAGLMALAGLAVMFAAGTKLRYLATIAAVALGGIALMITQMPNRAERFLAFLDIEAHKLDYALQPYRAMIAFGSGGITGVGLGDGRQKMLYLPFAHTDFIFPMIGEELGLVATLSVVLAFVVIAVCGAFISSCAPDPFGRLLGFGIVVLIVGQAIINIGVTTAVLPTKGIPLPFVSYGGSNLLCCLASIGILLNIARQARTPADTDTSLLARSEKVTPRLGA